MPTNSQQRVQWQWDQQEWVLQQQWAQQQWEQQQQWGAAQQQPGLCMYNLVQEQEQWWPQQQCAPPQQWAPPPQPGPIPGRVNNHQQMHDLQQTMCNMAIAAQSHMGSATSREHRRGLVMMSGCEVGREPTAPAAATWERQATLAALISKPATDKGTTANAEPPKLISDGRRRRQELLQDEYKAVRPDDACRRCGMTQEQHTPLRGTLQKHHLVPINQGGHPSDPANLYTLCHFCHSEWHSFWEHCFRGQCSTSKTWKVYMAATPYCKTVRTAGDRHDIQTVQLAADGCARCGVSAARCQMLRPSRTAFHGFERVHGQQDDETKVCYHCQREWKVFWALLHPDERQFFRAVPFRPMDQRL